MADNDGLAWQGGVIDGREAKINVQDVPGFAEQRGNLVEQTGLHAHELVFGRLADPGKVHLLFWFDRRQFASRITPGWDGGTGLSQRERIKTADGQGRGDLQRGRTAHAGA